MSERTDQTPAADWGGYEEAFQRLEQIVNRLERGDVPLEQAIEWFQEGMKLSQICSQKLDAAEQQIEKIMEQNGDFVRKPVFPDTQEEQ